MSLHCGRKVAKPKGFDTENMFASYEPGDIFCCEVLNTASPYHAFKLTCVTSDWRSIDWTFLLSLSRSVRHITSGKMRLNMNFNIVAVHFSWRSEVVQPKIWRFNTDLLFYCPLGATVDLYWLCNAAVVLWSVLLPHWSRVQTQVHHDVQLILSICFNGGN